MPDPTTAATTAAPESPKPFDPLHPDMTTIRRCRSLTIHGIQCRQSALRGGDYCVRHFNRGPVEFSTRGRITIPLLEDHSSVQLVCTRIAHAALNDEIKPENARIALSACKIAAITLPRPPRLSAADKPESSPSECYTDEEGSWIGPREPYRGPSGTFEPQWSVSKYMYEQQCEKLGKPKPTCAADFPASGWLTEAEITEDPHDFAVRYNARIDELTKQKKAEEERAAALAKQQKAADGSSAGDAEPAAPNAERPCWCGGPDSEFPCHICRAKKARSTPPEAPSSAHPGKANAAEPAAETPAAVSGNFDLNAAVEPAPRCPVVESVNRVTHLIPNDKKSVTHRKNTVSSPKRKSGSHRTLPLLSFHQSRARYFARDRNAPVSPPVSGR